MKDWLIKRLGGYTRHEMQHEMQVTRRDFDALVARLREEGRLVTMVDGPYAHVQDLTVIGPLLVAPGARVTVFSLYHEGEHIGWRREV